MGYYLANNGIDALTVAEEPLWVKEWIDKRSTKKTPKVEKPLDLEKVKQKKEDKWVNAVKDIQQKRFCKSRHFGTAQFKAKLLG